MDVNTQFRLRELDLYVDGFAYMGCFVTSSSLNAFPKVHILRICIANTISENVLSLPNT